MAFESETQRFVEAFGASAEQDPRVRSLLAGGSVHDSYRFAPFAVQYQRAEGARKWDLGGRPIIDLWMGHGSLLFGHGHRAIIEAVSTQLAAGTHLGGLSPVVLDWAEQICAMVPSAERVRFTASGTEATLLALRVARAFTGRPGVLRLDGHFHGWHDEALAYVAPVRASGLSAAVNDVAVGSDDAFDEIESFIADETTAAIIVEPGGGSSGGLFVDPQLLAQLRSLTTKHGTLLIFDEMVSGFREHPGGVQAKLGITPDLTTLGKILCGGLPGGALTGRAEIMQAFGEGATSGDREFRVPHTGTFNACPVSAAAGLASLRAAADGRAQALAKAAADRLCKGVNEAASTRGLDIFIYNNNTSVVHLQIGCHRYGYTPGPNMSYIELFGKHPELYHALRRELLVQGLDMHPLHGWLSAAHDDVIVDEAIAAFCGAFDELGHRPEFRLAAPGSSASGRPTPASNPMNKRVQLFINGAFCDGSTDQSFDSIDPANGRVVASVAQASEEDVDRAVVAARDAFNRGDWSRSSPASRKAMLEAVADAIESNQEIFARLETIDTGMPYSFTGAGHVTRAVEALRFFAGEIGRDYGNTYPGDGAYFHTTVREPIGVVGVITPWNGPLAILCMGVAAALACGNTCVVKPSELSPMTAYELARVFEALEFPPGVFNVLQGPGEVGHALAAHPGLDALSFTGSSEAGKKAMTAAAASATKFVGELGGNSATLILEDAQLDRAIEGVMVSAFSNNGEACIAGARLLVARPIMERFCERLVEQVKQLHPGNPLDPQTMLGPLISRAQRDRLLSLIEARRGSGFEARCGGGAPSSADLADGAYLEPTVLVADRPYAACDDLETLGPVITIYPLDDLDATIDLLNDSPYGLAHYVWTDSGAEGLRIAQALRSGVVWINSPMIRDLRVPFGGYRSSGVGRVGGSGASFEAFTQIKHISMAVQPYDFPWFTDLDANRDDPES